MDNLPKTEVKQRIIQEFVPGKQVTIAHIIAKPKPELFRKMGLAEESKKSHRHLDHHAERRLHCGRRYCV